MQLKQGKGGAKRRICLASSAILQRRMSCRQTVHALRVWKVACLAAFTMHGTSWLVCTCVWLLDGVQGTSDLFKLAVIEVACTRFYFSAPQALQVRAWRWHLWVRAQFCCFVVSLCAWDRGGICVRTLCEHVWVRGLHHPWRQNL